MWPEGKQCAVTFSFDLDAESAWADEDAPLMGLSLGTYGAKTGVPLILDLLKKRIKIRKTRDLSKFPTLPVIPTGKRIKKVPQP